ncbi:MAG: hypothetical protein ACE141_15575 [Bryobacteraceae bacterium]
MPAFANLALQLADLRGDSIRDIVRVELAAVSDATRYCNRERVQGELTLTGIACDPNPLYRLTVSPDCYRPRQVFVTLKPGQTVTRELAFPVEPAKVRRVLAPPYEFLPPPLRSILEPAAYAGLRPLQLACLLNLAAKTSATLLGDGRSCLDHLNGIVKIQQDRILARTRAALEEETSQSPLFRRVSGRLHPPPPGYRPARSYKTMDKHGNLQLTFFRRGEAGDDYLVDADIDEARSIQHVFEVARNAIAGRTHPYNVREILIATQGIDPGYSFLFA